MKLRNHLLGAALAAGMLATASCSHVAGSAALPATPSVSPATVTVTATATTPADPTTPSSNTPSPTAPSSTARSSSESSSAPGAPLGGDDTTAAPRPSDAPDTSTGPVTDTTTAWVGGICTGMGQVLDELVNSKPQLAPDASVSTLRQAMVDYYALSAKTVGAAYTASESLQPPAVSGGPAIHQAYQHFLAGLGDLFYNATLDMTDAKDLATITAVNDGVDQHITALGADNAALEAMSAGELAGIAKTIPACQAVSEAAAGS